MAADGFTKFKTLGVGVGAQVHAPDGLPYAFRGADGADAGAEIQQVFKFQSQLAQLTGIDAAMHRAAARRVFIWFVWHQRWLAFRRC